MLYIYYIIFILYIIYYILYIHVWFMQHKIEVYWVCHGNIMGIYSQQYDSLHVHISWIIYLNPWIVYIYTYTYIVIYSALHISWTKCRGSYHCLISAGRLMVLNFYITSAPMKFTVPYRKGWRSTMSRRCGSEHGFFSTSPMDSQG